MSSWQVEQLEHKVSRLEADNREIRRQLVELHRLVSRVTAK